MKKKFGFFIGYGYIISDTFEDIVKFSNKIMLNM